MDLLYDIYINLTKAVLTVKL